MGRDEPRMEKLLSRILKDGVLLSAILVIVGLVLTAVSRDTSCPYGSIDPSWVFGCNPFLKPSHVLFLGFFVLIATPVLRILASIMVFHKGGDTVFTLITSLVLLILLASFAFTIG